MAQASPIGGSIDPQAFPFLLVDLHRSGATGSLKVEGPAYQKALYFRTGRILFGSSNDPRDQLGAILIRGGKISEEQFAEVSARVGPGNPLAKVLAESGFVSQRELGDAARAKVEQILADVIAWEQGRFEFEDGVLPKGAVDLKLSTEKLFLSAVRQVPDRAFVLRHLESLAVVLEPAEASASGIAEVQPEAHGLPAQLDGRRSLKEAAAQARLDEFEAGKIACALLFLGLVRRQLAPEPDATEPQIFMAEGGTPAFGQPSAAPFRFDEEGAAAEGPEPTFFVDEAPSETKPVAAVRAAEAEEEEETLGPATVVIETANGLPQSGRQTVPFLFDGKEEPESPRPAPPPEEPAPAAPFVAAEATLRFESGPELGFASGGGSAPGFESDIDGEATLRKAKPASVAPPPPPAEPRAPATAPRPSPPAPPVAPAAPPVVPRAASKADLQALDAFLHARSAEGPLEPLEHRSSAPAARSSAPQSRRARRRPERHVNPWLLGVAGALALVAVAATAWVRLGPGVPEPLRRFAGLATPTPTPRRPAAVATPPPVAPSPTLAQASPIQAETPAAAPTPLPAGAPPAASPVRQAPTPAPAATPPVASRSAVTDASALLRDGDLAAAGQAFVARLSERRGAWSVQLLVACQADTVQKAVANTGAEALMVLPVAYKGRACHRLLWGLYGSEQEARGAVASVPGYFVQNGARPTPVAAAKVLP